MRDELKPCPFCGVLNDKEGITDATRILGVWRFIHRCKVIGPISIEDGNRDHVVAIWNTRRPEVTE